MFVERTEYNNVISIKIVIPSGCNAKCCFCYMNDYKECLSYNRQKFLDNFLQSLQDIIDKVDDKNPISVDITGNEPTYNLDLIKNILVKLKQFDVNSKVLRTTMTTNGYNLSEIIPYLEGVVDYVNISIHDFQENERSRIMGWCLTDAKCKSIVSELKQIGINCSAISVIHKPIPDFSQWMDKFISWCKNVGFIGLHFRCDVFWKEKNIFEDYMMATLIRNDFSTITHENTPDSHWCRLRRFDKFRVFFLKGVKDTTKATKGIEYIVADDGRAYCDYYKRMKIEDYPYEVGKIYDNQQMRSDKNIIEVIK